MIRFIESFGDLVERPAGLRPLAAAEPMACYEHMSIYKTAMDLKVYLEQVVRNFSRYHKHTLGSDLRQQSREFGP